MENLLSKIEINSNNRFLGFEIILDVIKGKSVILASTFIKKLFWVQHELDGLIYYPEEKYFAKIGNFKIQKNHRHFEIINYV